jgi:hypothetical protein
VRLQLVECTFPLKSKRRAEILSDIVHAFFVKVVQRFFEPRAATASEAAAREI